MSQHDLVVTVSTHPNLINKCTLKQGCVLTTNSIHQFWMLLTILPYQTTADKVFSMFPYNLTIMSKLLCHGKIENNNNPFNRCQQQFIITSMGQIIHLALSTHPCTLSTNLKHRFFFFNLPANPSWKDLIFPPIMDLPISTLQYYHIYNWRYVMLPVLTCEDPLNLYIKTQVVLSFVLLDIRQSQRMSLHIGTFRTTLFSLQLNGIITPITHITPPPSPPSPYWRLVKPKHFSITIIYLILLTMLWLLKEKHQETISICHFTTH